MGNLSEKARGWGLDKKEWRCLMKNALYNKLRLLPLKSEWFSDGGVSEKYYRRKLKKSHSGILRRNMKRFLEVGV